MAKSQNGYPANDRSQVSSRLVPGTTRKLTVRNGPAGDLLLEFAGRFDREVENIDAPQEVMDDWGYAERPIRGGTELSNHASGTAEDLNATQHPLGTQPSANYTRAQIDKIHALLREFEGCIRWGGDYTGRKDGMHFEIVKDEKACAAVLGKLRGKPKPKPQEDDLTPDQARKLDELHAMLRPGRVKVQTPGVLTRELAEVLVNGRAAKGTLAGIQDAITQLAQTGKVDVAKVTEAARAGAAAGAEKAIDEALAELEAAAAKEVSA